MTILLVAAGVALVAGAQAVQLIYRRHTPGLPFALFLLIEAAAIGLAVALIGLAVVDDAFFSVAFSAVFTIAFLCFLAIASRRIRKNEPPRT